MIIELIDEFYIAVLTQETLRGMIENVRKGYRNGGYPIAGSLGLNDIDNKKSYNVYS